MSRCVEAQMRVAYDIIALLLGGLIILTTLNDVFQTAIVPRAVGRRLRMSYYVWRGPGTCGRGLRGTSPEAIPNGVKTCSRCSRRQC